MDITDTGFCAGTAFAQNLSVKEKTEAYINNYKEIAIEEMLRTGVPASIKLAQGILESQFGESPLAKNANNHFGIKCKTEWTGEKTYQDDDARGECFRVYPSAEQSYRDHSDFLKPDLITPFYLNWNLPILPDGLMDLKEQVMQPALLIRKNY